MPLFDNSNMEQHPAGASSFGFSATRISDLGASEYTLVCVAVDTSGSVDGFKTDLEACVKEVVRSCQHSPRRDNLMLRLLKFDDSATELHGFRQLSECELVTYNDCVQIGGFTALYDAGVNAVGSVVDYAKALDRADYKANGIVVIITDGQDNVSSATEGAVREALERAVKSEALESLVTILVGVNVQRQTVKRYLEQFSKAAGFTQYVELGDASSSTLAKLAKFVSKSVSAQSQALGTGGPSQALTF
ncbi:vWA domain-containing protein [Nannocystis pusilla]|uniref:vWA domain-containing protein n=1 Tax=Nannocystis pusilla TaxID=889268 RepID=UPI003B7F7843